VFQGGTPKGRSFVTESGACHEEKSIRTNLEEKKNRRKIESAEPGGRKTLQNTCKGSRRGSKRLKLFSRKRMKKTNRGRGH